MQHRLTLQIFLIFIMIFAGGVSSTFAASSDKGNIKTKQKKTDKTEVVKSEIGLNIPKWGLAIDAIFDPRLDDIIPGYHIVNLVLSNRRPEPISLSAKEDRWIVVDHEGHKHVAQNHVALFNRKLWDKLPDKLKTMIDYPQSVGSGKSVTIDVFVPKSVTLSNFKEIIWKSSQFNKEFSMLTAYDQELSIPSEKEFDTPKVNGGSVNFDQLMKEQQFKTDPSYANTTQTPQLDENDENNTEITSLSDTQNLPNLQQEPPPFNPNLDNVIILDNKPTVPSE